MSYYYLVIPLLGVFKNYVKYKQVNVFVFLRTPFLNMIFESIFRYLSWRSPILLSIIWERIYFFVFKIIRSYLRDDYNRKKKKYMKKYNLIYQWKEYLTSTRGWYITLSFHLLTVVYYLSPPHLIYWGTSSRLTNRFRFDDL